MSVEDQASLGQPPPALPDGSIPTYVGHPLPGTGDGGPLSPPFGWGPDLDRFDQLDSVDGAGHEPPRAESPLLIVALIILSGVAVSVLIAAIAVRV
ncbi:MULTISPECIES: hypothetical protein [Kribbella]|uniref:Uncharacterized protein n=1 Tax=Kribbella pratensis TaxID=2512112 RepID=A0ABY2F5Z5_9ACTN|nr:MULTISPECIES: hypothetical protein [Kribbella]TDW83792.1 hypothetical protein EV137_6594 [Kribbella pratensis]TDW92332.1 hypothetical protein EV647_4169 [Kribbella sp. VKM Ac-2566]